MRHIGLGPAFRACNRRVIGQMLDFYEQFHAREPANVSFMRFPASAEGIGNVADTVFVHVFHSKKAFQIASTFIVAFRFIIPQQASDRKLNLHSWLAASKQNPSQDHVELLLRDLAQVTSSPNTSSAISRSCSSAVSRSKIISRAMTPGSGRLSEFSRDSSRSQKMSRLALSRAIRSA